MRRILPFVLLILAACGKDSIAPVTSVVGTWSLASVDGKALPATLIPASGSNCGLDVRGGSYTLSESGNYSASISYGTVVAGTLYCDATAAEQGTYTESGNVVTLHNAVGGGITTLTVGRSDLTRSADGHLFVYHK